MTINSPISFPKICHKVAILRDLKYLKNREKVEILSIVGGIQTQTYNCGEYVNTVIGTM